MKPKLHGIIAVGRRRLALHHDARPAFSTVTGTTCPSGRNTCVIPIFLPKIPGLIYDSIQRPDARLKLLSYFLSRTP